jgi:asparagine N-glycosylation enzyme membrane subunit Stt3
MPLTRRVVLVTAALAVTCFVLAVRRLRAGGGGWLLAGAAGALLAASPLVRNTVTYIRTDWFMMVPGLAALWCALCWSRELGGERGRARQLQVSALLGLLSGLAVSSKLSGAMVGMCVALWLLLAWIGRREQRNLAGFLRGPVCASLLAGAVCALVFYALDPRLWSEPLAGARDMLSRWDQLMRHVHDELEPRPDLIVARSVPERLALFFERSTGRDDAWRALTGLPGGTLLAALGLAALVWRARGLGSGDASALRAALALAFCCVTLGATALWIPLDRERFFLTAAPAMALLQASALLALGEAIVRAVRGRGARARAQAGET